MKMKLPSSTRNMLSIAGATIALISLFMIVFLFAVSTFLDKGGSYLGLLIYIFLPAFMIVGLILIPIGMLIKKKRMGKDEKEVEFRYPKIDFNDTRERNAFKIFAVGTTLLLFFSAIGSYEAYHYTESVEFCGTICHSVMHPEYTAYQDSPHSRVKCVSCHVGGGADWYVKSKLSGLYQVYSVLTNAYSKPIPTPIDNLRPARETCEECHWPEKFYDRKLISQRHYIADESNTQWNLDMIMKISGKHSAEGLSEGIHWHINKDVTIEYVARDDQLTDIPWVRYTDNGTGKAYIYENEDDPLEEGMLDSLELHIMDCMDCHNRPSHNYLPPAFFVNNGMASGEIPPALPEIKSLAMNLCDEEFSTMDSAMMSIESGIREFYAENYPELMETKIDLIQQAIEGLQKRYRKNIFPDMKVRWDAYPNHIGHVEFNGCFRCHTDMHSSDEGEVIRKDCNLCHTIISQGTPDALQVASVDSSLTFKHPTDIGGAWEFMFCTDCHTGLNP